MVVVRFSAIYIVFIGLLEAIISFCLYSANQEPGLVSERYSIEVFNIAGGFTWLSLALFLLNVHNIKWIFDDSGIRTEKEIYFGFFNIYNRKVAKSWKDIYYISYHSGLKYGGIFVYFYDKKKKSAEFPASELCIFNWSNNSNLKSALELAARKLPKKKFSGDVLEKMKNMGIKTMR